MSTPNIRALGITQDGFSMRWKATSDVEGMGWLEAWGNTLIEAMETLQARAAEIVKTKGQEGSPHEELDHSQASSPGHGHDGDDPSLPREQQRPQ